MQYGNYVSKNGKRSTLEIVALIAEDMAIALRNIDAEKPGCIVEKAEIIIKEETIGWKVALLEPGEDDEKKKTEKNKEDIHKQIEE